MSPASCETGDRITAKNTLAYGEGHLNGTSRAFIARYSILLCFLCSGIEAANPIRLNSLVGCTYIGERLEEFEDTSGSLAFADVQSQTFHNVGSKTVHHGFTDSVWWFRFSYDCAGVPEDQVYFLSMFNFRMYDASIYVATDGSLVRQMQSGMIGKRDVRTTDIAFRLPRTKNAATVYLRVKGITPVRFAPSIQSEEELRNNQLTSDMLIGLAMGGQFSLAIFNLVLFAAIRDRSYLSYGVFQILTVLLVLNGSGYTYEWFLSGYPMLDLFLTAPLGMLTSVAIILFSADFLHIGKGLPRSVVRYFIAGLALFALLSFVIPLRVSIRYSSYFAVAVCVLVFWLAIIRHRAGFGPARFFFVAFLPLLAFAFTFVISRFLTFIKTGPFSLHIFAAGLPLAILLSSVLFSVALSDRFQTLRNALRKTMAAKDELRMRNEQALREEKHRINRELHDVIGSDLSALIFELRKDHEHDSILPRLSRMLSRLRDLVHINALDPDFDLSSQIRSFLREIEMPSFYR